MTHLTELVEKWNLRPEVYKDAVEMLLDIHLEIGPPAKIVHYFEIIKEKWPNEEIPFAKIVKVGAAYHEMGEYERSYLVFRATVESNFARESEVAGFLQSQGELLRSVEAMSGLLRNYPPEGYVAAATYALAQQVAAKAPEAANDAKLRQQKVNRVDLLRRAWTMLEGFLDGLARRSGRRSGGLRLGQHALGPEGLSRSRPRPATAMPSAMPRATWSTATGTSSATANSPRAGTRRPWRCARRWPIRNASTRPPAAKWKARTSGRRSTSSARSITDWARRPTPSASIAAWKTALPTPRRRLPTSSARRSSCPR